MEQQGIAEQQVIPLLRTETGCTIAELNELDASLKKEDEMRSEVFDQRVVHETPRTQKMNQFIRLIKQSSLCDRADLMMEMQKEQEREDKNSLKK